MNFLKSGNQLPHCIYLLLILLLKFSTTITEGTENDGQLSFSVFHSFDNLESGQPPSYTPRGSIFIQSIKNHELNYKEGVMSSSDLLKLKKVSQEGGIYRIKVSSSGDGVSATSFTSACSIYESGLSDILTLSLDQGGNLLGVAIRGADTQCNKDVVPDRITFNTSVSLVQMLNAPVPDTQTFIMRVEQEKAEKVRGEHSDNRSFLAKYWMYIVPLVIFLLISGASQPDAAAGGAAR